MYTTELWNELRKGNRKQQKDIPITLSELQEHIQNNNTYNAEFFSETMEEEAKQFLDKYMGNDFTKHNDEIYDELLNSLFNETEVKIAIQSLKNGKAAGVDGIPPELYKTLQDSLVSPITILFNFILSKENYPGHWGKGLITLLHKKESELNPANYRKLTVQSVFPKIFDIIILNRLQFLAEIFMTSDPYNGGFKKNSCTADNMFILNTCIEKCKLQKKPLYVCFVDFKEAFPSINRFLLFYKVIKNGYDGRVIKLLLDMYGKTTSQIKLNNILSGMIKETYGVQQGGVLSPFHFIEYLKDLGQYLTKTGVYMSEEELINYILWADDLILISTSPTHLQNLLDELHNFCKQWHLIVNTMKTKILIFNKNKHCVTSFVYNYKAVDVVDEYLYLGCLYST